MKVLVDACVAASVSHALRSAQHDVDCVADWPNDPGDAEILAHAERHARVVLTIDKDFGELVIVRGMAHHGIVRLAGFSASQQASVAVAVLSRYETDLLCGAIVTAEPGRTRIRTSDT